MNLNTNNWKEFRFGDLTSNIYKAKSINRDDLNEATDIGCAIRYITRTGENNGCELLADAKYIDSKIIEKKNAISIGDTTATCFYQDEDFITGDHMVIVRADHWLNKYTALFILAILNNEKFKYSYGRAFLMDRIANTTVKLPIDFFGNPDWKFMEDYIKSLHYKPLTTKNKFGQAPDLNVKNWKEFNIQRTRNQAGLFEIENCKCNSADELDDGDDINYIGAKKNENGVMKRVALDAKLVSKGNGIMFICDGEGSVGYTNYMDKDFIGSTTTSIGYDDNLTELNAMFLVTILDGERFKYSYGRKYKTHIGEAKIFLPVKHNADGTAAIDTLCKYSNEGYVPDWEFMENYIKSLPYGDRL